MEITDYKLLNYSLPGVNQWMPKSKNPGGLVARVVESVKFVSPPHHPSLARMNLE